MEGHTQTKSGRMGKDIPQKPKENKRAGGAILSTRFLEMKS